MEREGQAACQDSIVGGAGTTCPGCEIKAWIHGLSGRQGIGMVESHLVTVQPGRWGASPEVTGDDMVVSAK